MDLQARVGVSPLALGSGGIDNSGASFALTKGATKSRSWKFVCQNATTNSAAGELLSQPSRPMTAFVASGMCFLRLPLTFCNAYIGFWHREAVVMRAWAQQTASILLNLSAAPLSQKLQMCAGYISECRRLQFASTFVDHLAQHLVNCKRSNPIQRL